ncbi:MAG TPA: hypothetical protein VGM92_02385, partial [Candidatus Kapabacteria bacterium]
EKASNKKRFSITTVAGAKIQPYFDVPAPSSPNLYFFRVQGESIAGNLIRLWVLPRTAKGLERILGTLNTESLSSAILSTVAESTDIALPPSSTVEEPISVIITQEAYDALVAGFQGKSDEHLMELFLDRLAH